MASRLPSRTLLRAIKLIPLFQFFTLAFAAPLIVLPRSLVSDRPFLSHLPRDLIQPNFVRVIFFLAEWIRLSQPSTARLFIFWSQ